MTSKRVLCFGEALWDFTPTGKLPGGAPMNVALRLALLGVDTQFLSRVGNDELGSELVRYMAEQGLNTDYVQVDEHQPTGSVNADVSDRHSIRYEIVAPAAWDYIDAMAFMEAAGSPADVVVFGSLAARHDVSLKSLLHILERTRLKVFDVNLRPPFDQRETVERLLHESDWVKLNENELDAISKWIGVDDTGDDALALIAAHYALEIVCLTRGASGATVLHGDALLRQAAFDVQVIDTIGCGDAFLGTWLAHMLDGDEPRNALRMACAAGAMAASRAGANPPVTVEMMFELLDGA